MLHGLPSLASFYSRCLLWYWPLICPLLYVTYLNLSLTLERQQQFSHCPLSWTVLSRCPQLRPIFLTFASRSRCHVFLGLPLFLLPLGFHLSAYLVILLLGFLSGWPIHLHILFLISSSAGIWLFLCPRSELLMVLGQRICRILLRQ